MDPIRIAKELIALKSYDDDDEPVAYMEGLLEATEAEVELVECNGIKNIHAVIGEGEAELGFNGHYDTVPPGRGWIKDPLKPVVEDGKLYGLGATDMKGGLACMLSAFVELARMDLPIKIVLQAVGDEEAGGERGTKALVEKKLYAKRMIIGEPGGETVSYGHKHILRTDITTKGKTAHGSRIYAGDNAIVRAARLIRRISDDRVLRMEASKEESPDIKTCNIGYIRGGEAINSVPAECLLGLDIRIPSEENIDDAEEYLKSILDDKSEIKITMKAKGMYTPPDHELIVTSKEISEEVLKKEMILKLKLGGCDGRHFTEKNIPTAVMGPTGTDEKGNRMMHRSDEYVETKDLLLWKEIYKNMGIHYAKNIV